MHARPGVSRVRDYPGAGRQPEPGAGYEVRQRPGVHPEGADAKACPRNEVVQPIGVVQQSRPVESEDPIERVGRRDEAEDLEAPSGPTAVSATYRAAASRPCAGSWPFRRGEEVSSDRDSRFQM